MKKDDEHFLAKWLSGDVSEAAKKDFEASGEADMYRKILQVANELETPTRSNDLLGKIDAQNDKKGDESIRTLPFSASMLYKIAAFIVVLLGLWYVFKPSAPNFSTGHGEQITVFLPDSSQVILNSKSSLAFDEGNWQYERTVHLEGEAFFKVKKGPQFQVLTDQGAIRVLGTSFNVNEGPDFFEVKCYSGKVAAAATDQKTSVLTLGMAKRVFKDTVEDWNFDPKELSWQEGVSRFRETPLFMVLFALENQFGLKFSNTEKYKDEKFTGVFLHSDAKLAVKTVLSAMQIDYMIENGTVLIE